MSIPEHTLRFWRAVDALFARVLPTRWGAVVTDGRFPAIWDANYARVDAPSAGVSLAEVAAELSPALAESRAETFHVVSFEPDVRSGLLSELVARGHGLSWDVVMQDDGSATIEGRSIAVDELVPDEPFWARVHEGLGLFGVEEPAAVDQLCRIEREVLAPGGKRWFGVRERGRIRSMAGSMVLGDVAYVDNVATFPRSRGRGYATAVTERIVREARRAGVEHVVLFADPDDDAVLRMYERLGFREVGRVASTKGAIPRPRP
jgi:ribosomal protein S18 acetylase RimI-like enzyme